MSNIVQLWEDGEEKVLNNLRFFTIWKSKLRTFDLRLAPNLEQLTIYKCEDFVELHIAADHHSKLKELYLSDSKLKTIHLRGTPNLEKLNLFDCNDLVEVEMPAESLKLECLNLSHSKLKTIHLGSSPNLERLNLSHSKLKTIHLGNTPNLRILNLENCYGLVDINAPIGCLRNLAFLDLCDCGRFKSFVFENWSQGKAGALCELHLIAEPTDVCPLHSDNDSPKFQFSCYYKEYAASSFGNLERLISIGLCACTNLESFSRSICSLQGIRRLTLEGSITEAPRDLDQLECLEGLTFSSTEIKYLPDSICMLKHLKCLEIKSCWLLEKLPDDIGRLESLEVLSLTECKLLQDIPNSICKMKCIKIFDLRGCIRIVELPEEIGCLEGLKDLSIEGTGITRLPQSIFKLRGLRIVGSTRLLDAYGLLLKRPNDDGIVYRLYCRKQMPLSSEGIVDR